MRCLNERPKWQRHIGPIVTVNNQNEAYFFNKDQKWSDWHQSRMKISCLWKVMTTWKFQKVMSGALFLVETINSLSTKMKRGDVYEALVGPGTRKTHLKSPYSPLKRSFDGFLVKTLFLHSFCTKSYWSNCDCKPSKEEYSFNRHEK